MEVITMQRKTELAKRMRLNIERTTYWAWKGEVVYYAALRASHEHLIDIKFGTVSKEEYNRVRFYISVTRFWGLMWKAEAEKFDKNGNNSYASFFPTNRVNLGKQEVI